MRKIIIIAAAATLATMAPAMAESVTDNRTSSGWLIPFDSPCDLPVMGKPHRVFEDYAACMEAALEQAENNAVQAQAEVARLEALAAENAAASTDKALAAKLQKEGFRLKTEALKLREGNAKLAAAQALAPAALEDATAELAKAKALARGELFGILAGDAKAAENRVLALRAIMASTPTPEVKISEMEETSATFIAMAKILAER
ncbi:MAG: hypothetical protein COY40_06320 [Alphaproteobacteria bacterium CG_4_10_14_0_8_um_filter_53_9]|nr:MAG: hypothetical protein COY40_06320 [Alphaproteobacteria bacterium CG_4_10_14_0_8_um_filter_53_9]